MLWPNTWIHYVLAERYVGLFIARESSSTLALDRTFIWFSFCCKYCPETSQIKPFMSEYNKLISYYSYIFIWLYSEKSKWHTLFLFFLCHRGSAFFPFVLCFPLVFTASFCRFTASRIFCHLHFFRKIWRNIEMLGPIDH